MRRLSERAEMHGSRINRSRHIFKFQRKAAGRKRELPHVAHQRHIRVVNGDIQIDLILLRTGRRNNYQSPLKFASEHSNLPGDPSVELAIELGSVPGTRRRTFLAAAISN